MNTITIEELIHIFGRSSYVIQKYKVTLFFFCFFYYQIDVKLKKPEISHSLVSNFEKKNIPFSEAFSDYTSEQVSERRNN